MQAEVVLALLVVVVITKSEGDGEGGGEEERLLPTTLGKVSRSVKTWSHDASLNLLSLIT